MSLIDEELVQLRLAAGTAEEALRKLANTLFAKGKVKASYEEAVVQREVSCPTGLPGAGLCIAVPHTDSSHVSEPAIAVGILDKPVPFHMMGTLDTVLSVEIVIMLAVDKAENHLAVLAKLMSTLQDQELLKRLKHATSSQEVCRLLATL